MVLRGEAATDTDVCPRNAGGGVVPQEYVAQPAACARIGRGKALGRGKSKASVYAVVVNRSGELGKVHIGDGEVVLDGLDPAGNGPERRFGLLVQVNDQDRMIGRAKREGVQDEKDRMRKAVRITTREASDDGVLVEPGERVVVDELDGGGEALLGRTDDLLLQPCPDSLVSEVRPEHRNRKSLRDSRHCGTIVPLRTWRRTAAPHQSRSTRRQKRILPSMLRGLSFPGR